MVEHGPLRQIVYRVSCCLLLVDTVGTIVLMLDHVEILLETTSNRYYFRFSLSPYRYALVKRLNKCRCIRWEQGNRLSTSTT